MICDMGLDLLQSTGEFPCAICCTGVGSNRFCNGCKHWVHKKCSGLKHLTKDPDYRCTGCKGNCMPLGQQTTEGSPAWQAGGGSFLLLPRRHALSSQWLWTFNNNMSENHLEEVQGAANSSLFPPLLFQDMPCTALVCGVQCSMPMRLGHWQNKPPISATEGQGNDQTDLQCQNHKTLSHQVQWGTSAVWHRGSGPHPEGEKAPLVWTCWMLQWCSQDSLWHTG